MRLVNDTVRKETCQVRQVIEAGRMKTCQVRQVNDAVRMETRQSDILMNSKPKFHQTPLVIEVLTTGLQEEQEDEVQVR